ncbi:DUF3892 domain-containing protein (plasmid) [Cytobacillus spongiae]|uniref:DUF3892 domain-containing protein n=1 Tax=Cytobacillus spongiae TaxID=2901381 RepID=UPI001CD352B7|nr:DUF3892 domain-containing protein [Cytobacillus spongiae]MCA1062611.1 DUF3892 domain-containing protein [Rossellomorea aquimaris]UII58250.1 DUF3892 domain-containing protein [Cytobacillus spongiae]WJV28721.1 DUF3892 domain-containing protein [Rossellomorea sp. AcN35-11]
MDGKSFEQIYEEYKQQGNVQVKVEMAHESEAGAEKIIAVRRNADDDLIAFKTESGRELDYITALKDAKEGKLAHVDVIHRYGRDVLRSEPDGLKENNLSELPSF